MSDDLQPNLAVIQSYVYHGNKCFFVSTIERTSSAAANPCRYNETLVWEWDATTRGRGSLLHQGEDACGSVREHIRICEAYLKLGSHPWSVA